MRFVRQALLAILFGPPIAFVTVISWFTVWPAIAFMEWAHEGRVNWRQLAEDSWGFADEFLNSLGNVR